MTLFKKGLQVTTSFISNYFQKLYITINSLTSLNISLLSTGSFLTVGEDADSNVVISEMMSVYEEQYFDSYIQPYYEVEYLNGWHGDENYLQSFIDEIELIQNR